MTRKDRPGAPFGSRETRFPALGVLLALTMVGWATRWLDISWWPLAVAQSLVPIAGIGVLLATVLAVLRRRRLTAWAGGAATVLVLVVAAPFVWPGRTVVAAPAPGSSSSPAHFVVLSSNLEFGQGDPARVLELVRDHDVDVLVLLECTPPARARLLEAGLGSLLPHEVGEPRPGADGTLIRSRHPLSQLDGPRMPPGLVDLGQPAARADTPAGPVTVLAAHPYPPSGPGAMRHWYAGLHAIGAWAQAQPRGIPVVMAGDFNASADHPVFRSAADGFVDAQAQAGAGWVRTWPQDSRVPAFVQLDHVLGRDLAGVVEAGSALVPGSDHAAVWAVWLLPPR